MARNRRVGKPAAPVLRDDPEPTDGKPVTQADYRGRIVLLYFGYTNCPDVCPATLANVPRRSARASAATRARCVCCSSPSTRTATPRPVLAAYVRNFGAEDRRVCAALPDEWRPLARRYRVCLFGDAGERRPPLRGDPQLGDLRVRRHRRGPADRGLAVLDDARRRRHRGRPEAPCRGTCIRLGLIARLRALGLIVCAVTAITSPWRRAPGNPRSRLSPSASRKATGTDCPGFIAALGDMHIR